MNKSYFDEVMQQNQQQINNVSNNLNQRLDQNQASVMQMNILLTAMLQKMKGHQ